MMFYKTYDLSSILKFIPSEFHMQKKKRRIELINKKKRKEAKTNRIFPGNRITKEFYNYKYYVNICLYIC